MSNPPFDIRPDLWEIPNYAPVVIAELEAHPACKGAFLACPGYDSLADVLKRAFDQASAGKGKDRHAQGKPFDAQPMQGICDLVGPAFALGQAIKKAQESLRLPPDRAVQELLGAINYLAGAVIAMERHSHG